MPPAAAYENGEGLLMTSSNCLQRTQRPSWLPNISKVGSIAPAISGVETTLYIPTGEICQEAGPNPLFVD